MSNFFSMAQKNLARSLPAVAIILAAGCGGGSGGGDTVAAPAPQLLATSAVSSADYMTLVQQLYIAYLGRPADPAGLANFQARLAALGAPNDIQALLVAYDTNTEIKALIDGFGNSAESQALYAGNNLQFVTAVYRNVLNRDPLLAGLDFWTSQIASGSTTRAKAALSIMAGALTNQSEQGQKDATSINKKLVAANGFTIGLIGLRSNKYSGSAAASRLRLLLPFVNDRLDRSPAPSLVADLLTEFFPDDSVIPFDTLTGHWSASSYDESLKGKVVQLDVAASSNLLTIKAAQSASDVCTYSATLNDVRNNVGAGTYQCSDASTGTWQLFDMYRIKADDIYISLIKDGKDVRRFYGKSAIDPRVPQQIFPSQLSNNAGYYYGVFSPREFFFAPREKGGRELGLSIYFEPNNDNYKTIKIHINGDNLTRSVNTFPWAVDCTFAATVQPDGRSLTGETFKCYSGETGTWKLVDLSIMPGDILQLSLVANGMQHRVYGVR
ncbi:MAG: DUF4214 domain-containing protein [Pseudomonadota bacterium]